MPEIKLANGLQLVPTSEVQLNRKDFVSSQEARWCPGCGDYSILSTVQQILPELGIKRENMVVISGIGCSSRFPYYLNSYGLHSIHGRAPSIATGLAMSRPDLAVMVVTGDGDALSIGGNHLIHALRRNVNITIVLFNNRIYGLTKGQFSPTSEQGKVTKSSPFGSADRPLNAVSLALGAEATFVARSIDNERAHLAEVLTAAFQHRGASLVEVYQNCPIFNDGAWDDLSNPAHAGQIRLVAGEPIKTADGLRGVYQCADGSVELALISERGEDDILRHDPTIDDPSRAFSLARLTDAGVMHQAPVGIFRQVERPVFDDLTRLPADHQVPTERWQQLLAGKDTWRVG